MNKELSERAKAVYAEYLSIANGCEDPWKRTELRNSAPQVYLALQSLSTPPEPSEGIKHPELSAYDAKQQAFNLIDDECVRRGILPPLKQPDCKDAEIARLKALLNEWQFLCEEKNKLLEGHPDKAMGLMVDALQYAKIGLLLAGHKDNPEDSAVAKINMALSDPSVQDFIERRGK